MFEYVLGATIGYDCSMSFQVSVDAAERHPFTGTILDLIAEGRSNAEIAEALAVEEKTVKNHITRLYSKLNIGSRYEAMRLRLAHLR